MTDELPTTESTNKKDRDYHYKHGICPEASHIPYDIAAMIHPLCGLPTGMAREMSIDELMSRTGNLTRNVVLSWTDNELAVADMYLKYIIPLLRRLQGLTDDERQKRMDKEGLFSE